MSRKTRTDYNDIFDKGLDNMSDLVSAFTKKNKRVHRIFDFDDDDVQANDQSYGLRLVSVHENEATSSNQTVGDKENKQERRNSTNVRPLSPVQINEAPPEQILESRSPFKHPSQLSNRQNVSLRRSLFQQQQQPKPKSNDIICSTPSTRNQGISNDFFGASSSRIESLSPIKRGLSNTIITVEDLKGIELIAPESNKNSQNGVIKSLHNLEKDLREQFQIDQETPKKSYSKSLAGDTSRRSVSETKNSPSRRSHFSEPITHSQSIKNCNVIVEPMEISRDTISMYRKSQLSRLSTSNLTNVNTFNMIETPVARQAKHSVINDSLLAKKLALCESDSEITDDEREPVQKLRVSARQSQAKKQKTAEKEELLTNDESDKALESPKRRKISQNIDSTPKKAPSRRPSYQSISIRQDPVEVQKNITNDESDDEDQQFELVIDEDRDTSSEIIVDTPKKVPSQRPSEAATQKSNRNVQEASKTSYVSPKKLPSRRPSKDVELASQRSKKTVQENQNILSDESDDEVPTKIDKNRRKNSQHVDSSPKKLPSRRPSNDFVAENIKSKKIDQEIQKVAASSQKSKKNYKTVVSDESDESEDERPTKKDKNPKKNVAEPKKKAPEKNKTVQTTVASEDMECSESEPENDKKEQASTKTSKQMSISDNIRKARKSTKSTEQMNMSESEPEDESKEQNTRKSTKNSEQMSMSEDESEKEIDPIKPDDNELSEKVSESDEESEDETAPKVQRTVKKQTAKKDDKNAQKGNKKNQKKVVESNDSETEYSDVSLSNYVPPKVPKQKTPPKAAKKKPDPPKNNKKVPKNKQSVSEESESDEEARNQAINIEEVKQFKKPDLFKKSLREKISCNMSNVSAGSLVPTEIVESFRTLQKPGNNTASIVPETSRISRPKGSKPRNLNPNKQKISEYLRLEKNVKHKKPKNETGKSRKRTLFNQTSDDEQLEGSADKNVVPEIDPIDYELSKELSAVRQSIDTMSNASSQPFTAEIPEHHESDDESEYESPKKKGTSADKQRIVDEIDQAPKTRGRPKKVKESVDNTNAASKIPTNIQKKEQKTKDRGQSKKNIEPVDSTNTVSTMEANDQEVEQKTRTRGRPKKTATQKVPAKKQQVAATEESDEESEDDSRQKASKVVKKTTMSKELMALTRRPASKRQNNTTDDTEPPRKTRRRVASNTSEEDESNSEGSKNTDEGFQSEEEYDDVWYDPMERGCQRQGLRVRKFMKSKDGRYAIQYGVFTKNDSKATQLQKQYNIKESEVHQSTLAPFIQPANKLELIQTLIMERKLKKKIEPPKKKEPVTKNKKEAAREKVNDGASTSRQAMEMESLASFATAGTNETQAGAINRLLDSFDRLKDDNTNPINIVETATYAISQINRLVWHPIGAGVYYSSFKENSFDGFLRLVKGGYKKGARTRLAVVKMTLLCGVVDIKINGTKLRIENLGFITITRGQSYRIMNASDETAIILMTRLDEDETTNQNMNSSSP